MFSQEDDPTYELPPVQRWQTRQDEEPPSILQSLREGLAETLAILGTRPGHLQDISELRAWDHEVDRIVQELLAQPGVDSLGLPLGPVVPLGRGCASMRS